MQDDSDGIPEGEPSDDEQGLGNTNQVQVRNYI